MQSAEKSDYASYAQALFSVSSGVGGFVVGQFEDWMFVNVGFDD